MAVVELIDWRTKQVVMSKKEKLKSEKIFIDHDLTIRERDIQKQIKEREKRKNGKKVKIGYKKLNIEGI